MAKRKTPARNAKGQFKKKARSNPRPKRRKTTRARKRRRPAKKRRRRKASGTTVVVRANPKRNPKRKRRRRRNPAMPPWAKVVVAAGGVAVAVELIKAYVPIKQLQTPAVQALLGPAAALGVGMFFSRKAKTKTMGIALIGAGVWQLAKYGSQYALAKIAEARAGKSPAANPYRRRRMVRRETQGVPADQKPRLAAGYTSMPATAHSAQSVYSM